ncbi:MAG: pantoate--beta-alanine ligase [Chitinophaga sp.]|jgi:pantoate--beta-alanine ligase|nr:pantoate--beta-alanine ligase [Chitinophaga sp.]
MILYKKTNDLSRKIAQLKNEKSFTIGFVPTMGALHNGHISLIEKSKLEADITVCSIFVNPTQFNDSKDFEKYPVTIEEDIYQLETAGCDILFLPSVDEIYPHGLALKKVYALGELENILEGKFRPNHFQGVCQVVEKLLEIVQPHQIFMGQKDYQQCMVVKKLLQLIDNTTTQLILSATQREQSGLAMSSRNIRLSNEAKYKATAIFQSLQFIKNNINNTSLQQLTEQAKENLINTGFEKIDYISICNAEDLSELKNYHPSTKTVVLIAAFIEGVRLIDNIVF